MSLKKRLLKNFYISQYLDIDINFNNTFNKPDLISDFKAYRNTEKEINLIINNFKNNPNLSKKYSFIINNIYKFKTQFLSKATNEISSQLRRYNKRYFGHQVERYVSIERYIKLILNKFYRQVENICLEESKTGERVYLPTFYERSPLIKGISKAEEIVFVLNSQIGDTILTLPAIYSVFKYLVLNKLTKEIKIIAKQQTILNLFISHLSNHIETFYYESTLNDLESNYFRQTAYKQRFVINLHSDFLGYSHFFKIKQENLANSIMSLDCRFLLKEEVPLSEYLIKHYYCLPERLARNFEVMLGQKLFNTITNENLFSFVSYTLQADQLKIKEKYKIQETERLVVISAGSSQYVKEYHPTKWEILIKMIFNKYKNVHILFLDDPGIHNFNEAIRSHYREYATLVDQMKTQGFRIDRVDETIDKIAVIISIADITITPDTGIGHLSGAMGTPTIMLFFGANPVLWKTSETFCVNHSKARELFSINAAIYDPIWDSKQKDYYFTEIDGKKIGTSDIAPEIVFKKVCKILSPEV